MNKHWLERKAKYNFTNDCLIEVNFYDTQCELLERRKILTAHNPKTLIFIYLFLSVRMCLTRIGSSRISFWSICSHKQLIKNNT